MERLLITALRKIVRIGSLRVTTHGGAIHEFGDGSGVMVAIRFNDARAQLEFIRDPDMKLGELYMDERIALGHGSIFDLVLVLVDNQSKFRPPFLLHAIDRLRFSAGRFRQRNFAGRSRSDVAHHYDLDSRLYRLLP